MLVMSQLFLYPQGTKSYTELTFHIIDLIPLKILILYHYLIEYVCSMRALKHEREFLAKRLNSRLSEEERDRLYKKWQVPLEGKQRKLQLVNKLWTDPIDKAHIEESADIVARLVGFCEGGNISKEMFELNFAVPVSKKPWLLGWQPISNLLRL